MVELLLALLITLTGIPRIVDPELAAIAQRRAVEISCEGCFSHSGWVYGRDGEAEIIAWNISPDPATTLAYQWQDSPPHWAILTDPRFDRWGCAIHQVGVAFYGACLFASGPQAVAQTVAPSSGGNGAGSNPAPEVPAPPPILLPDTSMEHP